MKSIYIYGPHAEEYSLARMNRGLAFSLDNIIKEKNLDYEVYLTARKEDVQRLPNKNDFEKYPLLRKLSKEYQGQKADIIIYNNFPKGQIEELGLANLNADIKLTYLAWEEDRFPQKWVKEYNQELTAVIATSRHTQKLLEKSGVKVPIIIVPIGLPEIFFTSNHNNSLIKSSKNYRFFHSSSGMERKGVAELIQAYTNEFNVTDDVALVIKSYPNANNLFRSLVDKAKIKINSPELEFIESDSLVEEEIKNLYLATQSYISPSKAEGYNLPVLEAMALNLPVVTTGWSGQLDFCNEENSYLVDYDLVPATSHLDNPGAYWAQVNVEDLQRKLRQVYTEYKTTSQLQKVKFAKEVALNRTWAKSAEKLIDYLTELQFIPTTKNLKLGVISTLNSVCGIAEYSSYLYSNLERCFASIIFIANSDVITNCPDGDNVVRLWEYSEANFSKVFNYLDEQVPQFDVIHIQYNFNFYSLILLEKLIAGITQRGIKLILTAHAVKERDQSLIVVNNLNQLWQIHVLNRQDEKYLRDSGLTNIFYFPHGNITFPQQSKSRLRDRLNIKNEPIVATHGFMTPNKGLFETLEAVAILKEIYPNILYLAVNTTNPNNLDSQRIADEFSTKIMELDLTDNVLYLTEFLAREEIILSLAIADIVIFAYHQSSETASGAVRLAIAASRPIIASTSAQLNNIQDIAAIIPNNQPTTIAAKIEELVTDQDKYFSYKLKVDEHGNKMSLENISLTYLSLVGLFVKS